MRFEAPPIHFRADTTVVQKVGLQGTSLSVQLPQITFRDLRVEKPVSSAVDRIPQTQLRLSYHAEARPTGIENYARRFTAEGGIELTYHDVERTLPVTLGKLALWIASSVVTYYAGCAWSPVEEFGWNVFALIILVLFYAWYFSRDMKVTRTVEIRPDCMIIEGMDTFWAVNMQLEWPSFYRDEEGDLVLAGVYGTRWIEYLTIPRTDENDRAPELFATQFTAAMKSQWELPTKGA